MKAHQVLHLAEIVSIELAGGAAVLWGEFAKTGKFAFGRSGPRADRVELHEAKGKAGILEPAAPFASRRSGRSAC